MADQATPFTTAELPLAQKEYFAQRFAIEGEIKDLTEEYLAELKAERKSLIAGFKARSGITTKVTDAHYKLFSLEREGPKLDEASAEIRRIDLERSWKAVSKGKTLNFIDAIEQEGNRPIPAETGESPLGQDDDFMATGHYGGDSEDDGDDVYSKAELTISTVDDDSRGEPEPEPEMHDAYSAAEQAKQGEDDYTDNEGELYEEGLRFGQAGNLDISTVIKMKKINPNGPGANAMRAGHTKGFDEFTLENPPAQPIALFGDDAAEDGIDLSGADAGEQHLDLAAQ